MAENQDQNSVMRAMADELASLRAQVEKIIKNVEEKAEAESSDLTRKLREELEKLRAGARDNYNKIYEAGQSGLESISNQVRGNPLASILVAFGAGAILSCILHRLK